MGLVAEGELERLERWWKGFKEERRRSEVATLCADTGADILAGCLVGLVVVVVVSGGEGQFDFV